MRNRSIFLVLMVALALAGCSSKSPAAQAVESYLNAMIAKQADTLSALSCAAWEEQAILEMDSFETVTASLDGLSCSEAGTEGEQTLVTCTGKIVTSYQGEAREFDLSRWTYQVAQEGGDWRVCGYR
jgi:uncharacterized protein YceK